MSESNTIILPSALDQAAAVGLKAMLAEALVSRVDLDASAVQRVSTLCFQLLLAALKSARASGRNPTIVNSSHEFRRAAETLGFATALGLEN